MDAYTIPAAASLAGVGRRELREAVESGIVPATRHDGRWFLRMREIEDLRLRLAPPAPALREAPGAEELTPLERRLEELEERIASLEARATGEPGEDRPTLAALAASPPATRRRRPAT